MVVMLLLMVKQKWSCTKRIGSLRYSEKSVAVPRGVCELQNLSQPRSGFLGRLHYDEDVKRASILPGATRMVFAGAL